jgi:hypothetical protein
MNDGNTSESESECLRGSPCPPCALIKLGHDQVELLSHCLLCIHTLYIGREHDVDYLFLYGPLGLEVGGVLDVVGRRVTALGVVAFDNLPNGPVDDLAVCCDSDNTLRFLLRSGESYDESSAAVHVFQLDGDPTDLVVADVFSGNPGSEVLVSLNPTNPSNTSAVNLFRRPVGGGDYIKEAVNVQGGCSALDVGAFLTSNLDLVVAHDTNLAIGNLSSTLTVLRNLGATFDVFTPVSYHTALAPSGLAVADYDEVGGPDLAAPGGFLLGGSDRPEQAFVAIHLNSGASSLVSDTASSINIDPNEIEGGERIAVGHLNPTCRAGGDSFPDAAVVTTVRRKVLLSLGNGDGTFQNPIQLGVGATRIPVDIAMGDIDEDGDGDLVTADIGTDPQSPASGAGMTVFRSRFCDIGTLTYGKTTLPAHPTIANRFLPRAVHLVDYTGDGNDDLIVGVDEINPLPVGYKVFIYEWQEATCPSYCTIAHFELIQEVSIENSPADISSGTIDLGGAIDLLVSLRASDSMGLPLADDSCNFLDKGGFAYLLGTTSTPPFDPAVHVKITSSLAPVDVRGAVAADLIPDAFNRNDVAVVSHCTDEVVIFGNTGSGFILRENHNVGSWPSAIRAADFNQDGRMDLAATCRESNHVAVLLGLLTEENGKWYADPVFVGSGTNCWDLAVADVDLDLNQRLDIETVNRGSDDLSTVLNPVNQ